MKNNYLNSELHKENLNNARLKAFSKVNCQFCGKTYTYANKNRHENSCYLNPSNIINCSVCNKPIKNYKTSKTCSYSCANKLFRSGPNHPNWKESAYQTTCAYYHKFECVVCGEDKIVETHHLDENHNNNSPENLIPLCPTHHQYWHSRYKHLIEETIINYIKNWKQAD